jgi:hypothetical protein
MKEQTETKKNIESKRVLLQRLFLIPNKYCLRENETGTSQILMNGAHDKSKLYYDEILHRGTGAIGL